MEQIVLHYAKSTWSHAVVSGVAKSALAFVYAATNDLDASLRSQQVAQHQSIASWFSGSQADEVRYYSLVSIFLVLLHSNSKSFNSS